MAALATGLIAAPLVAGAVPAHESGISAARLAARIQHGVHIGWSGEVRSLGSLQVPLSGSTFGGVARLLGGRSEQRVWWRDPESWRIDRLRSTGETDLVRDGGLTVQWNYEGNRVRFTPYTPVRLPDDVDVVPAALAARLLAGARPRELTRLPARRVAGRSAAGLRLVPSDRRSTISRVEVWADETSGLPLRVEVYGAPGARPSATILSTRVTSLRLGRPDAAKTDFTLSPSLDFSRGVALDVAAGANAFAPFVPPDTVAGLSRRGRVEDFGAVGVYGRGPTAVLAIPLRESVARELRAQLRSSSTSRETPRGVALEVGPLSVLLEHARSGNFLLTGTVTPQTLLRGAEDLASGVVRTQ